MCLTLTLIPPPLHFAFTAVSLQSRLLSMFNDEFRQVFFVLERRGSPGATVELLPCDLKVPGLTVEAASDLIIGTGEAACIPRLGFNFVIGPGSLPESAIIAEQQSAPSSPRSRSQPSLSHLRDSAMSSEVGPEFRKGRLNFWKHGWRRPWLALYGKEGWSLGATVELLPCDLKVPGFTVDAASDLIIGTGEAACIPRLGGSPGATVELLPCDLKVLGLTVEAASDLI
ncbi:hypothetical protein PIB30_031252 [Stylosanthes scabra]|uniref:Uncharacterized protein n=1 Tax=Stylosanthes scabra TaxID=79078 RepID=A0ABU6WCZ7_9FABA|nr:hypothetical protein [Stylosanthes scabra]